MRLEWKYRTHEHSCPMKTEDLARESNRTGFHQHLKGRTTTVVRILIASLLLLSLSHLPVLAAVPADGTYVFGSLGAATDGFKPEGNGFLLVSDVFLTWGSGELFTNLQSTSFSNAIIKVDNEDAASFTLDNMAFWHYNANECWYDSFTITGVKTDNSTVSTSLTGNIPGPTAANRAQATALGANFSSFTNIKELRFTITNYASWVENFTFYSITISDAVAPVTASAPTAMTNAATSVTGTGATLNGTVNANGASTTVTFEYGLTTSYGTTVTAAQSPVTGDSNTAVSKAITGLSDGTTYHYRVVGQNSQGTTNGADMTFTTIDNTPPAVSSIVRADANPTNAPNVDFTVTFSESVTGVSTGDFSLTGSASGSIASTSGNGSTYTVTVNSITGDGTLRLDLVDDDTIVDGASNPLGGAGVGNGNFTSGEVYTIDRVAPTLTAFARNTPATNLTNADTLVFNITFDESVANVDTGDFDITGTTATGVLAGSESAYTLTISGGDLTSLSGTVGLNLAGGQNITDTTGNSLPAGEPTTDETYTMDNTAPTIASITSTTADDTYGVNATINVTVTFSENVTLTGGTLDVTLDTTDVVNIAAFSNSTTAMGTYTVGAGDTSSDLDSTAIALSGGTLHDAAGNDATVSLPATTIADGSAIVVETNAVPTDIALSNSSVNQSGGVNATVGMLSTTDADSGDSHSYSLVSGAGDTNNASFNISGSTLRADDASAMAAGDYSVRIQTDDGNGGTHAQMFTITVVDDIDPTLTSVIPNTASITDTTVGADTFTLTLVFSEVMKLTVNPTTVFPTNGEDPTNTLQAPDGSWTNTTTYVITYDIADAGEEIANIDVRITEAQDAAGNTQTQKDEADSFSIDTLNPTVVSITRVGSTPTNANSIEFTVAFSENVNDVQKEDFTLTGTATGTIDSVSGSGATYTVTVTNVSGDGSLRLDVVP